MKPKQKTSTLVEVSNITEEQFDKLLEVLNSISKKLRIRNRLEVNKMMLDFARNTAEKNETIKKIENAASVLNNL